jgi:hypothetical protein
VCHPTKRGSSYGIAIGRNIDPDDLSLMTQSRASGRRTFVDILLARKKNWKQLPNIRIKGVECAV